MPEAGKKRERPPGPSMLAFWDDLLGPLVEAIRPERIVEIGSDRGTTTRVLLDYAASRGAVVHAIDPAPNFDVAALERQHPDSLVFHRDLSLDVLPQMEPVELALIDGDHNWHTVLNELRLLERRATDEGARPPVIALHDIGWPYGRRDLYYDPDTIPEDGRRPFERRAIHPDSEELVDEGLNPHLANAVRPAAAHSGVLGAIEDFLEESEVNWRLFKIPGEHGLGVIGPAEVLEEQGRAADLLEATGGADFLRARLESVERARLDAEIRRVKASRAAAAGATSEDVERLEEELAAARAEASSGREELLAARDDLEDAERRATRLKRQRDAADRREGELEDELAGRRRALRIAKEEVEAIEERRDRDRGKVAEVEAQLDSARAESEAGRRALAEAERRIEELESARREAVDARAHLVADFEESRDSLERTIDEVRAQADTGRHSAAELREMLEERELEIQRVNNQLLALQSAVGRARADSEVADAARAALERRLADLAERHERLLAEIGAPRLSVGEPGEEPAETEEASEPASPARPSEEQPPTRREPMDEEVEALRSFTSEYVPGNDSGLDPMALPSPRDRRRVLRRADEPTPDGPSVDVVVSVHNALDDVRNCLWSLTHKATYPFHLIVVDDGSDEETATYLAEVAEAHPEMTLIVNDSPPHGYTIAANIGMRASEADYVVLLNSDTIVSHGWLERIVACGESDERIGILGPLSNAASHQSVPALREEGGWATNPLPPFTTMDGLAKLLERISPRERPRMPFINGFCYVVKRRVLEEVGQFDEESFASGYCEENDLSFRAGEAGFELAVVDDCYVFHAKSKSYSPEGRKEIAKRNYRIFLDKHGEERINELVEKLESDAQLKPLRYAVSDALSSPSALTGALEASRHDRLDVAFILPGLGAGGSGGSHSIYQETKGLRELGVSAKVLIPERVWGRARSAYDDAQEVFVTFSDVDDLADKTSTANVVSATHFKSVAMLAGLRERRDDFVPAYYVQDYEPFFTSSDSDDVREAVDSYTAVPDCLLFAKTHWLCNIVGERHGVHVAKVEPSIDERVYRLGDVSGGVGPVRVVAMIRPRTPRRRPTATIAVLEELQRRFGDGVEVVTFGCEPEDMVRLTSSVSLLSNHQGLLTRQQVANLLNRSDVFLDMSMYQAFGRTALEAMACGCTAVVPRLGGVWEFLEDGVNGLAVDTLVEAEAIEALSGLVGDRERLRDLKREGRRTAERYSIGKAALSEYLVFSQERARRFGADRSRSVH